MRTSDLRIKSIRPLISPAVLLEELPLAEEGSLTVRRNREQIIGILNGSDDRLLVVVGPCSIHDPTAAVAYAHRLKAVAVELAQELHIVMRAYFEKPRTTVGWKGLVNDPHLDGTFAVNEGLRLARKLLLDLVDLGMPTGCEYLDPVSPQFLADINAWAAIGARTTESQVHRELASGLSMPVGFKNGTDGGVRIAIDAVCAAAYPHTFLGVTKEGLAAIVATTGNRDCHVILRGGESGPNYDSVSVERTLTSLCNSGAPARVMIDTSHGNSNKDYRRQPVVAHDAAVQVAKGQKGIIGVMIESFLVDGRQDMIDGSKLVFGQSITDACMGWDMTVPVLHELADAVRKRRERVDKQIG